MPDSGFTLEDFRRQMRDIRKLGSLAEIMKMIPGLSGMVSAVTGLASRAAESHPEREVRLIEGMINSMTPAERAETDLIEDSRCQRIARGSGSRPEDVQKLLSDFRAMRQMMRKLGGRSATQQIAVRRPRYERPGGFDNFELN